MDIAESDRTKGLKKKADAARQDLYAAEAKVKESKMQDGIDLFAAKGIMVGDKVLLKKTDGRSEAAFFWGIEPEYFTKAVFKAVKQDGTASKNNAKMWYPDSVEKLS